MKENDLKINVSEKHLQKNKTSANEKLTIKIKKVTNSAFYTAPFYATEGSAGMDLSAAIDKKITILPGERAMIPTGFALALPDKNHGAFVFARSGLSVKQGIALANGVGVVDSDYRGEIKVGLINLSDLPFDVEPGMRIAQLLIMPIARALPVTVEELPDSERGEGGFGSTGR